MNAIATAVNEAKKLPLGPQTGTTPDVVPLGHHANTYYFISASGEKIAFAPREMIRLNIVGLFGGDVSWLCGNFPVRSKKGEVIPGDFSVNEAAEWLILQCHHAGLFNPETPMRGLGVWRHREDVIAHFGTQLWRRSGLQRAGSVIGGAIYTAQNGIEEPDFANPADRFDGHRIRANLNAWGFTQDYDADLLMGFLGAALLGGFPSWRMHALITGERGTGKSTLGRLLMKAIGGQGKSLNDYSEAGVRQSLTNEARIVWLDEAESEGEDGAHRMGKVIALLRKMSDGVGASITRGSAGGKAINTTVTGCVLLTAINPPPLKPQDRSRILTIPIDKPSHPRPPEDVKAFLDEAAMMSRRLRSRALLGAQRFAATFDLFRPVLTGHGLDSRQADQVATLLAGRSLLLDDEIPSADEALKWAQMLRHRLRLIMLEDGDASDAQLCLNRLMDASCEAIRDGIKRSIGQVVAGGILPPGLPENDKLIPLGLRVVDIKGQQGERCLFVANDHLQLKRIFHNTPWADGNWRASLIRLSGIRPSPEPVSVGRKSRGLLIPKSLLPMPDGDDEVSPPDPAPRGSEC